MTRTPCYYCKTEDGIDRLGIGLSGRGGVHYWRPAFPPDVEDAPDIEAPPFPSFPRKRESRGAPDFDNINDLF